MNNPLAQLQLGDSKDLFSSVLASKNTDKWLASVSDDLSEWHIFDIAGNTRREALINLKFELADGSMLIDSQNRDLFVIAVEYLILLRIYMPNMTAAVYSRRITNLLTFYYWLSQHRTRSLQDVTRDHIKFYTQTIANGKEWATEAPQRLVKYLKHCRENNEKLPTEEHYLTRISRPHLYQAAGIQWPQNLSICAHIVRRVEKTGLTEELTLPIRDLLRLCGYTLRSNTKECIHLALLPIEELWEWKHQFSKPTLNLQPYLHGASKIARELGRSAERHKTIPPQIAMPYLGEALLWVINYSPVILRGIAQNWDCRGFTKSLSAIGLDITINDEQKIVLIRKRSVNRDGLIKLLGTACFIVIAGLSARRSGEILELGAGRCRRDSTGEYWLKTYIEKTSQEYDEIPVPESVYDAIICMETLSTTARQATNQDCIWQFQQLRDGKCHDIQPRYYLNHFHKFSRSLSEIKWEFTAHQFRRFFAIAYFWFYEKGDVAALSHHLRHYDLDMTRRYVTDTEFGRLWKDVQMEWQAEFVRDVVYGTRSVGGKAGHRLNQLIDKLLKHFRKDVEIVRVDRVVDRILRLVRTLGAPLKLHIWGTVCACPRKTSFAKLANCKGASAIGPDFSNATEELCGTCPFAIQTSNYISSAKSALTDRRNLTSGLTQDSLIHKFAASSCTNLEKIIEKEEPFPL